MNDNFTYHKDVFGLSSSDSPLNGTAANDVINALEGNDDIYSGSGNDTVISGAGNDYIVLGNGNDVIQINSSTDSGYESGVDYVGDFVQGEMSWTFLR